MQRGCPNGRKPGRLVYMPSSNVLDNVGCVSFVGRCVRRVTSQSIRSSADTVSVSTRGRTRREATIRGTPCAMICSVREIRSLCKLADKQVFALLTGLGNAYAV